MAWDTISLSKSKTTTRRLRGRVIAEPRQTGLLRNLRYAGISAWTSGRAQEKVDEFIDAARKRVGLILERGEFKWSFGHRSFQEYLAARYINRTTDGIAEIWAEVKDKVYRSWWSEPLKLLAGIYGFNQTKTLKNYVARILDDHKERQDPALRSLTLAGEIAGEVALEYPLLKTMSNEIVESFLDTEDLSSFSNARAPLPSRIIFIRLIP